MKKLCLISLVIVLLVVLVGGLSLTSCGEPTLDVDQLIKKLGEDEWRVREEATVKLIKIIEEEIKDDPPKTDSLNEVRKAMHGKDPEVRLRAKLIVRLASTQLKNPLVQEILTMLAVKFIINYDHFCIDVDKDRAQHDEKLYGDKLATAVLKFEDLAKISKAEGLFLDALQRCDGKGVLDALQAFREAINDSSMPSFRKEFANKVLDGIERNLKRDSDNIGGLPAPDGMPDWWEIKYGFNPNENDTGTDPDGDDRPSQQEYVENTNPQAMNDSHSGVITPTGTDVLVSLGREIQMAFSQINEEGETDIDISFFGVILPTAFKLIDYFYEVSTTSQYAGPITATFPYREYSVSGHEENLKLLQWNGEEWTDITVLVNEESNTITGMTNSLSPFVIVEPSPPPAQNIITIGVVRSFSCGLEQIGDYAFGPVLDYWVHRVNVAGGVNVTGTYLPVELHIRDDDSEMSKMVNLLDGMVSSGYYDFVFAPVGTKHLQVAAQLCNANEYILMGAEGGCTSIMDMLDELPYFFGVLNFADHNQIEELFKLFDTWGVETVAEIHNNDLDGLDYSGIAASEATKYPNIDIVMSEAVDPFTENVTAQLIEAKNTYDVDVFCAFTYPPTTMAVVAQAIVNDINFDAMVLGWGANFEYFRTIFGDDMVEGIIGLGAWNENTSSAAEAFAADMIAMRGRTYMDWWGQLYYYAGLQCFQQAIERAGSLDQSVIRDILATEHFTTVLGDTWFEDANGNHPIAEGGGLLAVECHPGQIGQWQSGIFEVIDLGPNNTATGIYPKPNWPTP